MNSLSKWLVFAMAIAVISPNGAEALFGNKKEAKEEIEVASKSAAPTGVNKVTLPFSIYTEKKTRSFFIPSGWMGDYRDLKINDGITQNPRSGETCMEISYSAKRGNQAGWAGIYWQYPANNWGTKRGSYDLSGAKKLVFWVRGSKGGEVLAECKVGGVTGQNYPGDSDSISIGPIDVTTDWKKYEIDLEGRDLSNIIGAFAWAASADDNPNGFVIYFDDIYFE